MTPRERVRATRRSLLVVLVLRAALWGSAAWLLVRVAAHVAGLAGGNPIAPDTLTLIAALAAIGASGLSLRGAWGLSIERVALWVEERLPDLRYALVTAVEPHYAASPLASRTEAIVDRTSWSRAVRDAVWRTLVPPIAVATIGAIVLAVLPAVSPMSIASARSAWALRRPASARGRAPFEGLTAIVRPPAYSGRQSFGLDAPSAIASLAGSDVTVSAHGDGSELQARVDGRTLPVIVSDAGWHVELTLGATPGVLRLQHRAGDRLIGLEPRTDSVPVVTLTAPVRDTVYRQPNGVIPLSAEAHDDIGLVRGAFEYIVSSGEGESFTFRSGSLGVSDFGGAPAGALHATLALASLGLKPGDVIHLRAVARDGNTVSGPGSGASETRALRIARTGEFDSVAVDGAAPPEADQSVISQRMLILLTEALERKRSSLSRATLLDEAAKISRDQTRLRKTVGEIIFTRLGDNPTGEESRDPAQSARADSGRKRISPDELLRLADSATGGRTEVLDFEGGESPVVAVNRPLLEAYNAMWDASRALDQAIPGRALPPMRIALAAIERARQAQRIYLRGKPPRAVVDIDRVRLTGKDSGAASTRSPHTAIDPATAARTDKLLRAVVMLRTNPAAAIDSLTLLRIDLLAVAPSAAAALGDGLTALRAGRDATEQLLRARRLLDGSVRTMPGIGAWSGGR
jgi:hypothetical protein